MYKNWSVIEWVGRILSAIAFCTVIWFVQPKKGQVYQLEEKVRVLEEQIGEHYRTAIRSLETTVKQLQAHDFSQPITAEDKGAITELYRDFSEKKGNTLS
ncbi:MAG: hypothetical protein ACI33P_07735 [Lysinibacillus sp.]